MVLVRSTSRLTAIRKLFSTGEEGNAHIEQFRSIYNFGKWTINRLSSNMHTH
jgi:hypothetical protein